MSIWMKGRRKYCSSAANHVWWANDARSEGLHSVLPILPLFEVFACGGSRCFALRGVTSSSTRNLTVRFTIPAWPFARSPNDVKSHVVVSKLEKLVCKQ